MKKHLQKFMAALALLLFIAIPSGMRGQETVTATSNTMTANVSYQDLETGKLIEYKNSASNSYSQPLRIYANNTFTIHAKEGVEKITQIAIVANNNSYANTTDNATWTATGDGSCTATASVSGTTVTVTITGTATTVTCKPSAQVRWDQLSVTYVTSGTPPAITYTMTYDANGGTGTLTDDNSPYDANATVTVLDNEFTREHFNFEKWNTKSDGTGTDYEEGDTFTITDNTTLYAQWESDGTGGEGSICFSNQSSCTAINSQSVTGEDDLGNTWTITTVGTSSFTSNSGYYQVGSGNSPATSITFTTTLDEEVNVTDFSAMFGGFSATRASVILKVDNTQVGSGTLNGGNDVTVSSSSAQIGTTLTVIVTPTAGGVKCYNISYAYETIDNPAVATTTTINVPANFNNDIYQGTTAGTLTATVSAESTPISGATVTWSSSNTGVATIDANGAVTLVAVGTTTITASYAGVEDQYRPSSATYELTVINSNAPGTQNNPYTVEQAIANTPASGSSDNVYIRGIVSAFYNTSIVGDGSNYRYYISDDGTTTAQLLVYKGKGLNQTTFTNANDLLVGDEVVIYGKLKMYLNASEIDANNYLTSWNRPVADVEAPTFSPVAGTYTEAQTVTISCTTNGATIYYTIDGTEPTNESTEYTAAITVSTTTTIKAIAYVGNVASNVATATYHINSQANPYTVAQALAFNEYPANGIYVHGIVSTAPTSLSSGTLTYYISDNGEAQNELEVYKGKDLGNVAFDAQDDIQVGDIVTVYGNVQVYNTTIEFGSGNYLVSFERPVVPVINADDITLAYDATSGEITYTVSNPVEGTILNATTTADWISNIVVGSENITFATTANNGEDNRTATITLTYGSVTKDVTVTQEVYTAPVTTGTIVFGNNGTKINSNSTNQGGQTGSDSMGNTWTITTSGTTSFTQNTDYSQVGKAAEPATSITFTTTLPTAATVTSFEAKFGGFNGTAGNVVLSVDNTSVGTGSLNGSNDVTVESTTSATGTVLSVVVSDIDKGVKCYYISYTLSTSTEPFISVTPNEAEVVYNGGIPEFAITYANMAITSASSLDVQFYEADGITTITKPSWIGDVEFSDGTTGESYDLFVEVNANTGAERSAYFKVYAMDEETNLVYSNLVTITQAEAPQLYTLTISNLSHVNLFVFGGDESETIIETESGQTTAQVYNGTEVTISVDIEEGYVFQSLTITDANGDPLETEVLTLHEYYAFIMPASNVTITATAVEAPAADDYELFSGNIIEGDYLIVYDNAAMNTTATSNRLQYDEVTPNNNVITTANTAIVWHIAPSGNYWTIYNAEANAYAAATGSKNQAQMLGDGTDDKALWTVTGIETYDFENKARAAASSDPNNKWLRKNTNYGFACYASGTGGALSLYKKVENIPVEPSIAVTPEEVYVDAGGHEGTLDINYTNLTISDMTDFDIQYYDANGDEAEAPDWIEVLVVEQDPTIGEGYVVSYYMLENDGAERMAYFKIYAMDDETNLVYSYLVTVTQAGVPHTVYFFEGTGDCDVVSLTGSSITLPEATASQGWTFFGWAEAPVNETETAPSTVSSPYAPAQDLNLYAIYHNVTEGKYNSFPACVFTELDVTEGFEGYSNEVEHTRTNVKPTGWTVVTQYEPIAQSKIGRPQVYNKPPYSHDGTYCLIMDTLSLLAMPKLQDGIVVSQIQMELYVRQSWDVHALEIGVMSDLTDPSSYVSIAIIDNEGNAVNKKIIDFSNYDDNLGGRYIVFKNFYQELSYGIKSFNYIDDIKIVEYVESTCGITDLSEAVWGFEADEANTATIEDCWTLVNKDKYNDSQYNPSLISNANHANTGQTSLKLDGECLYAMPEFKVPNKTLSDVQMEFYVKQYSANCKLRVGVMKDVNNPGSFKEVAVISNDGASGSLRYVIDFSDPAYDVTPEYKYIAFRNFYNGSWGRSINYIDDIVLSELVESTCGITDLSNAEWGFEPDEANTETVEDCWTLSKRDKYRDHQYDPSLISNANHANTGQTSLKLDGECLYAMPEFKIPNKTLSDVQMEFYVKQYSANCKLRVGVMTDVNDPSTFKEVAVISNEGASGSQRYVIDFGDPAYEVTSEYKYIAFRNFYNGVWGRSINYIDDIVLSEPVESTCGITDLSNAVWGFEPDEANTATIEDCWTLSRRDMYNDPQYDPSLISNANHANTGQTSLKLDGECLYAMPEFKVPNKTLSDIQMEFYVKQYSANCKLRVGVMTDVNNPATFKEVAVISNDGAPGSQRFVINFGNPDYEITSDYKYIAFRNFYNGVWGRSINYIDDIVLSEPVESTCGITDLSNAVWGFEPDEANTATIEDCWTLSRRDKYNDPQYDPSLISNANHANTGQTSLKLDGECLYAMPEFKVPNKTLSDVQMEFYVKQYSANCKLRVGVMTDVNNPATFKEVAVISNDGVSGSHVFVINFSNPDYEITGEYKYIAFRNFYNGTWGRSINYIDDITLSLISNENPEPETEVAQNESANTEDTEFDNNSANSEEPFNAPNAISNFNAAQLSLYPNPTSGKVTLVADEVTMVEVYSQIGSKVATFTMNNERVIDLANLPKGVYILRVTMPQGVAIHKVVKN